MQPTALATSRQAAGDAVKAMTRPEGIGKMAWEGVQKLLWAVVRSYPKAYPSQAILAERVGRDVRSVRRYQALAVAAGLLQVTPDAGKKGTNGTWSKTNQYHITLSSMSEDKLSYKETPSTSYLGVPTPSETPSPEGVHSGAARPKRSNVIPMHRGDQPFQAETERQVGSSKPEQRSKRPRLPQRDADAIVAHIDSRKRAQVRKPRPTPPAVQLVEYFSEQWEAVVLSCRPEYKSIRVLETVGEALGYCRRKFLAGTPAFTLDEVRQFMDEFMAAAANGDIRIKTGQSVWRRFTGSWGRQRSVQLGDPYAEARAQRDAFDATYRASDETTG